MQRLKPFFTMLTMLATLPILAQYTDVINSNRPGVSKAAFSVGTNVLQFELGGYTVKEEHTPLNYEISGFGVDFAARFGLLLEELEVNVEGTFQNDTFTSNTSAIPFEDSRSNFRSFTIGAKYLVYDPYKNAEEEKPNLYSYHANRRFKWKSLIPAVAVYLGANIDSKNNPFVPYTPFTQSVDGGFSPKIMIATQNNFAGGWVFVMNFLKDRIGTDYSDFQYILTLTHSFSDQWVLFGEAQGIQSDFYADNIFRFGGAYLWTKNFQLDANIAFNAKDTPSVFNIAFGASYRLDWHKDKKIDNGGNVEDKTDTSNRKKKRKKKNTDFDSDNI
ncbi:outer membrane putative beta-barrel porin/alpha-amylase [Winogradskyella wandonensis]|uniref:Outer membrane putative beta-barrel porin/alpha-amylase n=1 Tax=Winogradskyella wandonensis TaxID=1442586 RepID=A0A4R1KXP0_9FLAO|nr:transporter [Winogradskyella wandonensis]TCK69377.1 outer membrane putative beta-barrel porin/alpha-amylase [Winogradskyella wandonensis]